MLLIMGCSESIKDSLDGAVSNETVSFTASVVEMTETKATLKYSWSADDKIALFVGDAQTAVPQTVDEAGILSGDQITIERETSITYTAFYPYNASLTSLDDYKDACTAGEIDHMQATTTSASNDVELHFTHSLAALTFTLPFESDDIIVSLALDGKISDAVVLTHDSLVANYFVEDGTDISSALLLLEQDGETTVISIKKDDTNTLEAGKQYLFSCNMD